MYRHGQRLYHRAFAVCHRFRQRRHLARVHGKIFTGCACRLEPHHPKFLAQIVLAVRARMAPTAVDLRFDGHLLPYGKSRHALAQRRDFPRHLVALGDRIFCERMLAVIHMDIRPAHADLHDLYQYLARVGCGYGRLPELDVPRRRHHLLQHFLHSESSSPVCTRSAFVWQHHHFDGF